LDELNSGLQKIKLEEFVSSYLSKYNLPLIARGLFHLRHSKEEHACLEDLMKESKDGLLRASGLDNFTNFFDFNSKNLLLIIAYPNLFIPKPTANSVFFNPSLIRKNLPKLRAKNTNKGIKIKFFKKSLKDIEINALGNPYYESQPYYAFKTSIPKH